MIGLRLLKAMFGIENRTPGFKNIEPEVDQMSKEKSTEPNRALKNSSPAFLKEEQLNYDDLEKVDAGNLHLLNVILFSCLIIFAWAAFAPLDVISMATGVVQPDSKVQKIHHLEGGILRGIHVKDGDLVKMGQPLVSLSSTQYAADAGEVAARINAMQVDVWRLESEATNRETITFPEIFTKNHPDLVEKSKALYSARRDSFRQSVMAQEQDISAKQAELNEIQSRLSNTRERYRLALEQSQIGERLLARQLSNRYEQIDREKESVALKSRIEEDEAATKRLKLIISKARAELSSLRSKYEGDIRKELADVRRQLAENTSHNERLMDSLMRTELVAPVSGVVKTLFFTNPGAVIPPGGEVLDIVPEDDKLIVEAHLPLQDIGFISLGQTAIVQLASSDATRFGRILGKVEYISADSITPKESNSYYNVKIALDKSFFGSEGDKYILIPGVPVTVGIVTGKRTILEYLIYPIMRTLPFSLGER